MFCLWSLLSFSACSHDDKQLVDKLNSLSYANHYRNLDSTEIYAQKAFVLADGYGDGKAEALNNLAFVDIMRMNYRDARKALATVEKHTDNQVELLIADVLSMRICQRMSENRSFYDFRQCAIDRIKRIDEEQENLNSHNKQRLLYAKSEFAIVSSAYYYYVGFDSLSANALSCIDGDGEIRRDTAQYLNYLYNIGSGGVIVGATAEETCLREFECHATCYLLAKEYGYTFFMANSMEAMAEILLQPNVHDLLLTHTSMAVSNIWYGIDGISLLPKELARQSLFLFEKYGDAYQVAGAYRTLASCLIAECDYQGAFDCLQKALSDEKIQQAPDLVASIREQLSIVYSGLNDKHGSDYNRNIYLDLQEQTRQDRYMESRAEGLENTILQLNCMIAITIVAIVILLVLLFCFDYYSRKRNRNLHSGDLLRPLEEWQKRFNKQMDELRNERETLAIRMDVCIARRQEYKLRNLENRAKLSLVNSIIPFIDRMINELDRLVSRKDNAEERERRYTYVSELVDKINEYNDVLTHWIQLQQGQINLKIESFNLMDVFDVLAKSEMSFKLKGINFKMEPSDVMVKADKVLTLFMLNTLADNARKFTPKGGSVCVNAVKTSDYVEISVKDTGAGLSDDELASIFNHKVYNGHGFGLLNCKGIIDKYKKVSNIFNVCGLFAESVKGKGSRFYFRLPYGVARCLSIFVFCLVTLANVHAGKVTNTVPYNLQKAGAFADSAYYNNVRGEFDKTLVFADSTLYYLNRHYWSLHPGNTSFMVMEGGSESMPAELKWFHDGVKTNYDIILDIRNECAVAALALNEWDLYVYNNRVYTSLFKERSADKGLDDYCKTMQASSSNKIIAIIILALLLVGIVFAFYFLYYRHVLYFRFCVERIDKANNVLLSDIDDKSKLNYIGSIDVSKYPVVLKDVVNKIKETLIRSVSYDEPRRLSLEYQEDELNRVIYETEKVYISNNIIDNCLSTLKHETMYYPARIRQLVDNVDMDMQSVKELVYYYKELYTILYGQVKSQADEAKFNCAPVSLKDYVCVDDFVLFDEVLLSYLFDVLKESCGYISSETIVANADGKYLTLRLSCNKINHTDTGNFDYFAPLVQNIPFLICRQIIREMAEITNMHGCGLRVVSEGCGATFVYMTFARAHMFTELKSKEMEQ